MLTADNYAANLRTAARNAATAAGVTGLAPSSWTLAQRQTYNQTLARQILQYPGSFSPESQNTAAVVNTEYGLRGHAFDSALQTAAGSAADTIRTLNPLDAQNIATTGKWLLVAVVALAAFWLLINRRPSSPA